MTTLAITKTYLDGTILTEAQLDSVKSSIETTVNGLLETATNIDFAGTIRFALNGNDSLGWNDTTDILKLTVDAVDVFNIEEGAAVIKIRTLVSNADMEFWVNDGGVDTRVLKLTGADFSATFYGALTVTGTLTASGTFSMTGDLVVTSPHITTGIQDANGLEIIDFGATASAVNQIKISNAATTGKPKLEALGDDTNVSLDLDAKGTGIIQLLQAGVSQTVALTDAANIATDASLGNVFTVTLAGNRTLDNPTNATAGQTILYRVTQDATGTRTLVYGANFRFSTDLASPTLSTAANKVDYLGFTYNGAATKWDVVFISKGY